MCARVCVCVRVRVRAYTQMCAQQVCTCVHCDVGERAWFAGRDHLVCVLVQLVRVQRLYGLVVSMGCEIKSALHRRGGDTHLCQ